MKTSRDIRVSTVVMGHPARADRAESLVREHSELGIEVVVDPGARANPVTLPTARLAWSRVRDDATHHLVLRDDALLCRDFPAVLSQALSVAPPGAVALFANWTHSTAQAIRLAALGGASWTPFVDPWTPTHALVLPAGLAREFASFSARYSDDKPDDRAMFEFLADRGVAVHVAVPNLVDHQPAGSLPFDGLLRGARGATVFLATDDTTIEPFTDRVVAPPAVAHVGLGDLEALGHYEPLVGSPDSSTAPSHEVLITYGMTPAILGESFSSDLDYHPGALATGVGESMLFQFWITMFLQGVIAKGTLESTIGLDLDRAFDTYRWARPALGTFVAGALCRTFPREDLLTIAEEVTPLCVSAMRAGFAAVEHWPELSALWQPDRYAIRPRWNRGEKDASQVA